MKTVTTTLRVRRFTSRHDFTSRQELVLETHQFGVLIRSEVIDTEEVPTWASIQLATLGSTDWVSRFTDHIA